jgi:hypothetical protein
MILKIRELYLKRGKNMPFPGFETLKTVKNRNATLFLVGGSIDFNYANRMN